MTTIPNPLTVSKRQRRATEKAVDNYRPAAGTNGGYNYRSAPATPDEVADQQRQERFWRSLGKKIRHGSWIGVL